MTSASHDTATASDEAEARYGITSVTIKQYEYGGFRYTNLADAVAQAKRSEAKRGDA